MMVPIHTLIAYSAIEDPHDSPERHHQVWQFCTQRQGDHEESQDHLLKIKERNDAAGADNLNLEGSKAKQQ